MFGRNPKLVLHLDPTDNFKDCKHYISTFDYGVHPRRVFAYCAVCQKYALLDWKDTYGRTMNRIWGTLPALITAAFAIITVAFIIYAVTKLG